MGAPRAECSRLIPVWCGMYMRQRRRTNGYHMPRVAVVALALVALALALLIRAGSPPSSASSLTGQPAPGFSLRAERDGHYLPEPVSLDAQRGHPVLLLFMYTLCPHCLSETLTVASFIAADAPRGLRLLAIDSPAEGLDIVAAYQQRIGLDAPVLLDTSAIVASQYGVRYFPTVVFIDARGIVRRVWVGEADARALASALSAMLDRNGGGADAQPHEEHGSGFD